MVSKIIIDANILLDISLSRSADVKELKEIYAEIVKGRFRCYITTSIIHICGYWLKKNMSLSDSKNIACHVK